MEEKENLAPKVETPVETAKKLLKVHPHDKALKPIMVSDGVYTYEGAEEA